VRVSSGVPRSDQPGGDVAGSGTSVADRKWASSGDNASVEGRTGPSVGVVPDSQQLFVGNLPHNVDDKELVEFFTSESQNCPSISLSRVFVQSPGKSEKSFDVAAENETKSG